MIGFGTAAVVAGDLIFVSRPGEFALFPMPGSGPGSVHVFRRGANSWTEVGVVTAPGGEYGDGFGQALAAQPGLLVVGAPGEDEGRGAIYVFVGMGNSWDFMERIQPPDAMPGDAFGSSVAVGGDGTFGVIGAPGRGASGSVFGYFMSNYGMERTEITGSDAPADARFGASLSLEGNLVLIGAPGPFSLGSFGQPAPPQPGVGYVFQRSGNDFEEVARLTQAGGMVLGASVAMAGGEALIGSPFGAQGMGAVYRFAADDAGEWSHTGEVGGTGGRTPGTLFGYSVGLAGERLVVGAPGAGQGMGGAHVYAMGEDGEWSEETALNAEITGLIGFMGNSVAGGDGFAVVGAPGAAFFEGVGYVFERGSDGAWSEAHPIHEAVSGPRAVTGGEQRCSEEGEVAGFPCSEIELLSFLPTTEVGGARGIMVSDIWGWVDPQTGREYAILGRFDGTSFIDVTDAENPVYLGNLPLTEGASPNLWRDMKVYDDHVFVVADNAGQHGLQVFDLAKLRDVASAPVVFDEDAHYSAFASAHNIVINEESGFAYVVGASGGGETCGGALHMVDIRDPRNPSFAGCYSDPATGQNGPGYTHDAQCVMYSGPDEDYAGREICFNASETALGIGDVTDKENPVPVASASYPNVAYSHQGWLTEDQRYFYLNDELDELQGGTSGTRTLVWDVQDLDDPILAQEFVQDNPASDHNLYVRGNYMYQSNYVSGLRVFDISDPENPVPAGFFDTVAGSPDVAGFAGSWSNYPFFPSGNIVVSSMREGLFVLKLRREELVP